MVSIWCVKLDWQLILLVFIIENVFNRCDVGLTLKKRLLWVQYMETDLSVCVETKMLDASSLYRV